MGKYPECKKLSRVSGESNKLGDFIDWLYERGIFLAEYPKGCEHHKPYLEVRNACGLGHKLDEFDCGPGCQDYSETEIGDLRTTNHTKERLLADYFEVDLAVVDEERRAMLEEMRK